MAVEKSYALSSSSSFLRDRSLLRSFLGHQSVSLMSSVSCVGLSAFLLLRTHWPKLITGSPRHMGLGNIIPIFLCLKERKVTYLANGINEIVTTVLERTLFL